MPKAKDNRHLETMKKNVEHLRYRLARYQIARVAPPVNLLIELKMAENLYKIESMNLKRTDVKV